MNPGWAAPHPVHTANRGLEVEVEGAEGLLGHGGLRSGPRGEVCASRSCEWVPLTARREEGPRSYSGRNRVQPTGPCAQGQRSQKCCQDLDFQFGGREQSTQPALRKQGRTRVWVRSQAAMSMVTC